MSATTASGRTSSTSGTVIRVSGNAASYGFIGCPGVGNTGSSGAGANAIPPATTSSSQRPQVCSVTSWPRADSARPSAIIGKA